MKWNKETVLVYLALGGEITKLAQNYNVTRSTVYKYIKLDKDLLKAFKDYKKQIAKALKNLK